MIKKGILLALLFLLIIPAFWSLLQPGFFPSDDGEWMVVRLTDFHRSISSGQLPVRWAARLNQNYGYPVFNFLYPLSLYTGEIFHLVGFGYADSIKIVFIFSIVLAAISMFLFVGRIWGRWAGLAAAVVYTYTPYRLLDIYVRGSLGEALSFAFPPLLFLGIYRLCRRPGKKYYILTAVSFAALIMSHNIMAMVFTPAVLLWLLILARRSSGQKINPAPLLALVFGLGLSAFFWLPALNDSRYTVLGQVSVTDYREHFLSAVDLLIPSWGYGPSLPGGGSAASYQVGVVNLLALAFGLVTLFKKSKHRKHALFFLLISFVALLLLTPISLPVWELFPLLKLVQFPWRLLALIAFSSSVLSAIAFRLVRNKYKPFLAVAIIIPVVLVGAQYARPEYFVNRDEGFYTTNEATTTVKDEYLPIWAKSRPAERAQSPVEIISGRGEINRVSAKTGRITADLNLETESRLQINQLYFPGWKAKTDRVSAPLSYDNPFGLMQIVLPPGGHRLVATFSETPLRLLADFISIISLAGLIWVCKKNA